MDYVAILNIGVIGLGFLLASMAYKLLKTVNDRRGPYFLIFSLLVIVAGLTSEFMRRNLDADIASTHNELNLAQEKIRGLQQIIENIKSMSEKKNAEMKLRIDTILIDIDDGVKAAGECAREASGASTNTSDAPACTRAAFAAARYGREAVSKIQGARGRVEALH